MSTDEMSRDELRTLVIQRLEDVRAAGVTNATRSLALLTEKTRTVGVGSSQPVAPRPAPALSHAMKRDVRESPAPLMPPPSPANVAPAPSTRFPPPLVAPNPSAVLSTGSLKGDAVLGRSSASSPPRTREERCQLLTSLAGQVAGCRRCTELAETRQKTVFGVGNPEARLLFLGEAPGADEDRQGIPFVGRAGQLLDKIIEAIQMRRDEVYICNILKCRPPGNRQPAPNEAENCREYLLEQLRIIAPEFIVCWGSVAARNLLATTEPIGKMRGRVFTLGAIKVICTYHPAYLLRNPPAKKETWEDMKFLLREMGRPIDDPPKS